MELDWAMVNGNGLKNKTHDYTYSASENVWPKKKYNAHHNAMPSDRLG